MLSEARVNAGLRGVAWQELHKTPERYFNRLLMSTIICADRGRRNKHGIPLRKLLIFGKTGLEEMRGWQKKHLR